MENEISTRAKSKGHIGFDGDFEFYAGANGDVFRANIGNVIDIYGYRSGRFESSAASWAHFGPKLFPQLFGNRRS